MEILGKITRVYDLKSGVSSTGREWQSREFVIETQEQNAKYLCFTLWSEQASDFKPENVLNKLANVKFNIESREYKDRWYTTLKVFDVLIIEK